jgi:outer membrane protein OmpA-like peptidoglycan-associated protein
MTESMSVTIDPRGRRLLDPLEREPEPGAPPVVERPRPPRDARSPLLDLQRRMGNAALSRQVTADPAVDAARARADVELAVFMSHHWAKESFKPSTGGGLFDVDYDPAAGAMVVTVRIAFKFATGNVLDPTWFAAIGGMAGFAARGYKAEDFIWTDDEKTKWRTQAVSDIQSVWSERYTFFTKKPYWEGLPPVNVRVMIADAPETGDHDEKAQWVVTVNKWPDDANLEESMSWPTDRSKNRSTGHLEESSRDAGGITSPDVSHFSRSTGTRNRYGQVDTDNPTPIQFAQGKADVSAADATALQKFGATLGAPDMPPFPVTVTGRASSEGTSDRNRSLSEERARNVSNEIVKGGPQAQPTSESKGADGASTDPAWRRVEIAVGTFEGDQRTVTHEFGHMLGLDDEYPTADPVNVGDPPGARPVGGAPTHAALVQSLMPGQQAVQAHHSDNIMSNGEVVRPHHYVTFLEALGTMTGTTGLWDIAPSTGTGGHGPGDFPVPVLKPDGPAMA